MYALLSKKDIDFCQLFVLKWSFGQWKQTDFGFNIKILPNFNKKYVLQIKKPPNNNEVQLILGRG